MPADFKRFPTPAYTDGGSIFVPRATATCFGGKGDRQDSGATASGIRTDMNGGVVGCALPMPLVKACDGTPFAVLPWKTIVVVSMLGWQIECPLIDVGPAGGLKSGALIDLTPNAVQSLLGLSKPLPGAASVWSGTVAFQIYAVGEYQADYWPKGAGEKPPWWG